MAESVASIGFGVLLKRGDGGGSEVFTAISEIIGEITGPGWKLDTHEASHTASPSGFKERLAGMKDAGEVSFKCNFLMDATQNLAAGILLDLKNGTKRNFQIVWPFSTPQTISLKAFVVEFTPSVPINGVMTVAIKLQLTTLPTIA